MHISADIQRITLNASFISCTPVFSDFCICFILCFYVCIVCLQYILYLCFVVFHCILFAALWRNKSNKMNINFTKTKEMILGPLAKSPPQLLSDCSTNNPVSVERVQHFKLLGITLSHDINWQAHIDAIITKASSRLYFLKILISQVFKHTNSDTSTYRS